MRATPASRATLRRKLIYTTVALGVALPAGMATFTTGAEAAAGTHSLRSGEVLHEGQSLVNGNYTLAMQSDGNLVLYAGNHPMWQSGTAGSHGSEAAMQSDGNLVVYDSGNHPLWASGTAGHAGAHLEVQGDANSVIYDASDRPLWATGTAGRDTTTSVAPTGLPARARSIGYNPYAAQFSDQCTYYAEKRMFQATGRYMPVHGNAYQFAAQARAGGWTVGAAPAVNSVAVFPAGSFGSKVGHVGWVVQLASGRVRIQDYNWGYSGATVHDHWVTPPPGTQYIYSDR